MKFLRSRYFIICLLVAVILSLVPAVLAAFGQTDVIRSGLKTIAKPFEIAGSYVADAISGFTGIFSDYDRLKAENEALKDTIESMEAEAHDNTVIKEENDWLKKYLELHSEHPEYLLADARVISCESGNYATVLTLDKGRVHGILRNTPVLTPDGVLGHVSEVGLDWCKVESIVESESSVAGYAERSGALGVVEGDIGLRAKGYCKMSYDADADIKAGDRVYTSGTGSIYPSGLFVGTIISVEADSVTRTLVATVEPAVEYDTLSSLGRVMLICGYDVEG